MLSGTFTGGHLFQSGNFSSVTQLQPQEAFLGVGWSSAAREDALAAAQLHGRAGAGCALRLDLSSVPAAKILP